MAKSVYYGQTTTIISVNQKAQQALEKAKQNANVTDDDDEDEDQLMQAPLPHTHLYGKKLGQKITKQGSLKEIVEKLKAPKKGKPLKSKGKEFDSIKVPESWDWRDYGILTQVKFQVIRNV